MSQSEHIFDAIVIGGGHNGLIAAAYLGKAGKRVLLLEASTRLGGALTTAEISPDYRVSTATHLLDTLPKQIEKDLKLAQHGLRYAMRKVPTIVLDRDHNHIKFSAQKEDADILRRHSEADVEAFAAYQDQLKSVAALLRPLLFGALPEDESNSMASRLRRLVWRAEFMGSRKLEKLMRQLPGSIGDHLNDRFESPLLKGALALDAVIGTANGPFEAGTAFAAMARHGLRSLSGGPHLIEGGLGGYTDALAEAALSFGVTIKAATAVREIKIADGRVSGVVTDSDETYEAPLVLSSAHPRKTIMKLAGARHFDAGLVKQADGISDTGATAKLNLSLEDLPTIQGLAPAEYSARFLVVPSLTCLDEAFTAFKHGDFASTLPLEVTFPSVADPRLAPHGRHVMSILMQYVPYDVPGGWEQHRDRLVDRVLETLRVHMPDIRNRIVSGELMLPPDIERKFGLTRGGWHQGDMRIDQMLTFRPAPGMSRYATPVKGLYLCGTGSHPGSGVSGLPGKLAAEAVLKEGRRS